MVLFEHDELLNSFRDEINNPTSILTTCPTKLAVTTELMMAQAENRLAHLELSVNNVLFSPKDLGGFVETGLNEDGSEHVHQLRELLQKRFIKATDLVHFGTFVDGIVDAVGSAEDSLGELEGLRYIRERKSRLADILEDLYETYRWRYYFRFDSESELNQEMIEPIKNVTQLLHF